MKQSRDPFRRFRNLSLSAALLGNVFLIAACANSEKSPEQAETTAVEAECKDGLDNDRDGRADCADPDCQSPGGDCIAAPALDRTVASTVADTAAFLYTGDNPLQKGSNPKAFDKKRVAMLHGKVLSAVGTPLAGATVSVQGHKEYGYTFTRSDGTYDLAVNGGSRLILDFSIDAYLPAQRATQPGWQRHVPVDDLGMVQANGKTTALAAGAADSQTIAGTAVTDAYGSRQPLVVVEPGTTAKAVLADGTKQDLSALTVTVTEFPVGTSGLFLPGSPPSATAISYALDFEVAEATKLNARHVEFSEPISLYVENFLGLPVGVVTPPSIYDRSSGQWETGKTGQVIKILAIAGGAAALDCDGDGVADDATVLAALGITSSDLKRLAERYPVGTELWYSKIAHFSDALLQAKLNAPKGAVAPTGSGFKTGSLDHPSRRGPILVEPQAITNGIPITGTPYSLEYQSHRARGYGSAYQLELPLTGAQLPSGLKRISYRVSVAGKIYDGTAPAVANSRPIVTWDGTDNHGRLLQSPQRAAVYIGYVYDGTLSSGKGSTAPSEVTLGDTFYVDLGLWDATSFELGGFGLDVLHAYDPASHSIYFGYGDQKSGDNVALVTKPTNLVPTFSLGTPDSVFVASDGSIIFTDDQQNDVNALGRVIRTTPDGKPSVLAGPGAAGAAASVKLDQPQGIVVLDDGSVIVADILQSAIRRIDPSGTMTTLVSANAADNPQVLYSLSKADGIALGPRQELYIVDVDRLLVLEAGKLSTFAGGGTETGDKGLAVNAMLARLSSVAVSSDGIVYLTERDGHRIRKILADGSITNVAGNGTAGFAGDGAAAREAQLSSPRGIALAPDGSIYFADQGNNRIRRITPDGLIFTVVGGGKSPPSAGTLATGMSLDNPDGIAIGPDGALYVTTMTDIFRIVQGLPDFGTTDNLIPSEDGRTLYHFDDRGKHLSTIDAVTGVTELTFGYDANGLLATITDKRGLATTVKRDAQGVPASIVGPYGQVTAIEISADGNMAKVTDPIARSVQLTWSPTTGLLSSVIDPTAKKTTFTYDPVGRLTDVSDPTDATSATASTKDHLTPSVTSEGYLSVSATTKEGRVTEYLSRNMTPDTWHRAIRQPDGSRRDWTESPSAPVSVARDGTKTTSYMVPDMVFGSQTMVPAEIDVALPSGKTLVATPMRIKQVSDINNVLSLEDWRDEVMVNNRLYATEYNRTARTVTATSPMGRISVTTLDTQGRPVAMVAPGMPAVALTYDASGRIATVTRASATETRSEVRGYGADGWLAKQTNPLSEQIGYSWDPVGRPKTITRADANSTSWTFDAADNVKTLTPPGRQAHAFEYDPTTKMLTLSTPPAVAQTGAPLLAGQQSYGYGLDDELVSITHSDGRGIAFAYSATTGQLTSQTLGTATLTFGYDKGGILSSVNRSDGVKVEMTHDGPLWTGSSWTGAVSGTVKADYDKNFWLKTLTVNDASSVSFSYDDDGLLIGASSAAGAMTVARDANTGMVTGTTLGAVTTANTYNGFAELSSLSAAVSSGVVLSQNMERDALGRITHIVENALGASHDMTYKYDTVGRLVTATRDGVTTTYGYDANGNRISVQAGATAPVVATFDAQDRIVTQGTTAFELTPHGDLLRKSDASGLQELSYDELGNLLKAKVTNGTGTTTIDYVVDGLGRRVARKVNGEFDRKWLYRDALRPVAEIDAAGTFTHFVYADSRSGAPDFMIRSGVLLRVVKDHLGSVRAIVNAQTGAVVQAIEYDAYGVVLSDSNPGYQPFGFAGGLCDAVTGLVRFGARDYDAATGRWTNKDPIGFAGGDTNIYAYVGGDPVNSVDPDGRRPLTANEKAFLTKYYGASLNVDAIDIGELPALAQSLGLGGLSPWPGKILLPKGFFDKRNPMNELVLSSSTVARDFAHEAFHVWQRQHGRLGVAVEGLALGVGTVLGVDAYGYAPRSAHYILLQFLQGGLEQQARIFQDYVVADLVGSAAAKRLFSEVAAYVQSRPL